MRIRVLLPQTKFRARLRQQLGRDVVNTLLDYTYALLYTCCHRALVLAGVDPRIGFVHTDGADGKLSMVYDFVEEFRAVGADRVILVNADPRNHHSAHEGRHPDATIAAENSQGICAQP